MYINISFHYVYDFLFECTTYPRNFFRFCEKKRKKAFRLLFSSIASFSIQEDATFFYLFKHGSTRLNLAQLVSTRLNLTQPCSTWLNWAQLDSTGLNWAQLGSIWFNSAQLGSAWLILAHILS